MPKPPKTARPKKPPIRPAQKNEQIDHTIGLIQEKLIGRIVVAWSRLEGTMDDLIWQLLKLDLASGRIVTTRLDAVAKIKMLRDLGKIKLVIEAQFHKLSEVLDRIDILREDRNLITHGLWGRNARAASRSLCHCG
jgi:hypothetical protein